MANDTTRDRLIAVIRARLEAAFPCPRDAVCAAYKRPSRCPECLHPLDDEAGDVADAVLAACPELDLQARIRAWAEVCFSAEVADDRTERNHRFLEESLELAQAAGATAEECHQLVDYVFGRPRGEIEVEVGDVIGTLALLCAARKVDMLTCGERGLARVWANIDKIRAKRAAKPEFGPLPVSADA